jgi:hypothetical protein
MLIERSVHDDIAESPELRSAEWLREEITDHLVSWAICKSDVLAFGDIRHKKLSDVHVPCPFSA